MPDAVSQTVSIIDRLNRYLAGSRPHHALILAGPHTLKKETMLRKFAAKLICKTSTDYLDGVNVEDRVLRDIHPDVAWIKEEGEDTIKIDRIREICHQMEIAPLEAQAKICVIEECHRMNSAAANAFLKTLEEPLPNRFFWLMTSQVGSLLPTLLSRCLVFLFPPEDLKTEVPISPHWADFEHAWKNGRFEQFTARIDEKPQAVAFVKTLQQALRNTVLAQHDFLPLSSDSTSTQPTVPGLTTASALRAFDGAIRLEAQLRSNANFSLLLESTLTQFKSGML